MKYSVWVKHGGDYARKDIEAPTAEDACAIVRGNLADIGLFDYRDITDLMLRNLGQSFTIVGALPSEQCKHWSSAKDVESAVWETAPQ